MQFLNSIAFCINSNTEGTMVKKERRTVFNIGFAKAALLRNVILAPCCRDGIGGVANP